MQNHLKDELHNVLSGKSEVRFGAIIQSVSCYLNNCKESSSNVKIEKHYKEKESKELEKFISDNNLWINDLDFSQYVTEGAEQKVYLKDNDHVLK